MKGYLWLRYCATGESFTNIHYQVGLGTRDIVQTIPKLRRPYLLAWEMSTWRLPNSFNCLGELDGKHIVMRKPWHAKYAYHKHKVTKTFNRMAITDVRYKYGLDLSLKSTLFKYNSIGLFLTCTVILIHKFMYLVKYALQMLLFSTFFCYVYFYFILMIFNIDFGFNKS